MNFGAVPCRRFVPLAIILIGAAVRFHAAFPRPLYYSSDTAILDLMARHLQRGEFSLYYWGEHYYGALDWVLLCALFSKFGQTLAVSTAIPYAASLLFLMLLYRYLVRSSELFIAIVTTLLLAVPATMFIKFTFGTYNYSFGVCLGILQLLLAVDYGRTKWSSFLCGLCAGFSFYYFRFVIVFLAGFILQRFVHGQYLRKAVVKFDEDYRRVRSFGLRALLLSSTGNKGADVISSLLNYSGFFILIASIPLWVHGNIEGIKSFPNFKIFFGDTLSFALKLLLIGVSLSKRKTLKDIFLNCWSVSSSRFFCTGFLVGDLPALIGYLIHLSPSSPGGQLVSLPVMMRNFRIFCQSILPQFIELRSQPIVAAVSGCISLAAILVCIFLPIDQLFKGLRCGQSEKAVGVLPPLIYVGFTSLLLGLLSIRLVDQGSARYFLPFAIGLALSTALVLKKVAKYSRPFSLFLLSIVLVNNAYANYLVYRNAPVSDLQEELSRKLIDEGYEGGYADYWVAYRLTAVSHERLIVVPTGNNDRYPNYLLQVRKMRKAFLIAGPDLHRGEVIELKGTTYVVDSNDEIAGQRVLMLSLAAVHWLES